MRGGTPTTPATRKVAIDKQVTRALRTARSADRRARAAVVAASVSPVGPPGPPGDFGPPGPAGQTGATGDSGATGASPLDGELPAGVTVTGSWFQVFSRSDGGEFRLVVSLPARAPAPLGDENVGFAPASGFADNDELPSRCTGTPAAPTAAPGYACLYVEPSALLNVTPNIGLIGAALDPAGGPSGANRSGFTVRALTPSSPPSTPNNEVRIGGTWAYTAPAS